MIKCNLSTLMGQHKIRSILKLEQATGIRRLQLTKLYDDKWERIEKWQIDALCKYFGCSISDLFEYTPDPIEEPPE